jgi:hypothetical protein
MAEDNESCNYYVLRVYTGPKYCGTSDIGIPLSIDPYEGYVSRGKEIADLRERLAEAEGVIDSAMDDTCSNMDEYRQKDCRESLVEFDWCTSCMARSYRDKHPKGE